MGGFLERLAERLGNEGVTPREYMRWVQASVGARIRMIPTSDILFFRAEDKYTRVQTAGFEALIRKPIKELIEELDPNEFWQIHRATVVRVDAIAEVSRNFRGKQVVHCEGPRRQARGEPHVQPSVQADVESPSRRVTRILCRGSPSRSLWPRSRSSPAHSRCPTCVDCGRHRRR